ncbi:hypothetical protein CAAN3_05S01750 [[Candida] anglica]
MRLNFIYVGSIIFLVVHHVQLAKANGIDSSIEKSISNAFTASDNNNYNCTAIHEIPRADQCEFIREECSDYKLGYINYLRLYYCTFSFLRLGAIVPLLIILGLLFVSLGLTASDYLCPNLYTISVFLKMSDNLAGLTLLALGNGAPDILSTFTAMDLGSGDLAISELVGAAFFITTVVVGTMGILHPFKVPEVPFIRDAGFFAAVTIVLFHASLTQKLTTIHCIVLVSLYLIYVVIVISSHSIAKSRSRQRMRQIRARGNYIHGTERLSSVNDEVDEEFGDVDGDAVYLEDLDTLPTIEELLNNHNNQLTSERVLRSNTSSSLPTGHYGLNVLLKNLQQHSNNGSIQLPYDVDNDIVITGRSATAPEMSSTQPEETQTNIRPPPTRYRDDDSDSESLEVRYQGNIISTSRSTSSLLSKLFIPNLTSFKTMSLHNKIFNLAMLPIFILLRVSVPVRDQASVHKLDFQERAQFDSQFAPQQSTDIIDDDPIDYDFDRTLLRIQIFFAVTLIACVWFDHVTHFWSTVFPISVILSIILSMCVYLFYQKINGIRRIRIFYYVSSVIGFITSITWVSIFATEIVAILKIVSLIYNISDEVLGLTVFALGNSVGDFISNYTIASMGMPLMAFGACFGGPILTFSSLGVSGLIIINGSPDYEGAYILKKSSTLAILILGLGASLSFLLMRVTTNNMVVDKKIGTILICNWIVTTTICLILECI